jgi:hypothetical protein
VAWTWNEEEWARGRRVMGLTFELLLRITAPNLSLLDK